MPKWPRFGGPWLPIATLSMVLAVPSAHALVSGQRHRDCANGAGYSDYFGGTFTGDLGNPFAPFRVVIPDQGWNGKLLAYARGTGSAVKTGPDGVPLDVDGNPLVDFANQAPLLGFTPLNNALPEITAEGSLILPDDPDAFEDELVCEKKYAAVVSDYKPDLEFLTTGKLGWVVEDGVRDIGLAMAQAQRLLLFTKGARASRTILIGRSQGSLVALRYAEARSPQVDGVVTACTVGAGASRSWDSAVDVALAVDVAFSPAFDGQGGWPWGASPGDAGNVNDNVAFNTNVAPVLNTWLTTDPIAFGRLEFVRLVSGLPRAGFYPFSNPDIDVVGNPQFNWLGTALLFATEVKADIELKAGGAVGQNLDHVYSLTDQDKAYLAQLGLGSLVNVWLEQMNTRPKYAGSDAGRAYTAKFNDLNFEGRQAPPPMLSLHTTTDGLVLPSQETELRQTLDETGRPAFRKQLLQKFVQANGHCVLTRAEWGVALAAMEQRLDAGRWPSDAFFPNDPTITDNDKRLRFVSFDPGPYPQPPLP